MKISIKHLLTLLTCIIVQVTVFGQLNFLGFYPKRRGKQRHMGLRRLTGNQCIARTKLPNADSRRDRSNQYNTHTACPKYRSICDIKRGMALPMLPMKKGGLDIIDLRYSPSTPSILSDLRQTPSICKPPTISLSMNKDMPTFLEAICMLGEWTCLT